MGLIMSRHAIVAVLVVAAVVIMLGCGGLPKHLNSDESKDYSRLAIVTSMADKRLRMLNHSGIDRDYSSGFGGALGGLLDALARKSIHKAHSALMSPESLGGQPQLLREALLDFDMKKCFDENFRRVFLLDKHIVGAQDLDSLGFHSFPELPVRRGAPGYDYSLLLDELSIDLVLEMQLTYGLATYGGGIKPSAVVVAELRVIDLDKNSIKMETAISSDLRYKKAYSIDEFRANGAEIFRREIVEAVEALARVVASEFGAELSLKHKSYWHSAP